MNPSPLASSIASLAAAPAAPPRQPSFIRSMPSLVRVSTLAVVVLSLAACASPVDSKSDAVSGDESNLDSTVNPGFTIKKSSASTLGTKASFTFKVGLTFEGSIDTNCIAMNPDGSQYFLGDGDISYPSTPQTVNFTNGASETLLLDAGVSWGDTGADQGELELFDPKVDPGISLSPASLVGREAGNVVELAPGDSVSVTLPQRDPARAASASFACRTKSSFPARPRFSYGAQIEYSTRLERRHSGQ